MQPIYDRIGDIKPSIAKLAMDSSNGLSEQARQDLWGYTQLQSAVETAVYSLEYLWKLYAAATPAVQSVTGALAQIVDADSYHITGSSINNEPSRAYAMWQIEKKRQGDSDADTSVSAPLLLVDPTNPNGGTIPLAPTIASISPATSAANAPNTNVAVTGTNLDAVDEVTVGGVAAKFVAISATQLTLVVPGAAQAQPAPVVATNPGGQSSPFNFSYT